MCCNWNKLFLYLSCSSILYLRSLVVFHVDSMTSLLWLVSFTCMWSAEGVCLSRLFYTCNSSDCVLGSVLGDLHSVLYPNAACALTTLLLACCFHCLCRYSITHQWRIEVWSVSAGLPLKLNSHDCRKREWCAWCCYRNSAALLNCDLTCADLWQKATLCAAIRRWAFLKKRNGKSFWDQSEHVCGLKHGLQVQKYCCWVFVVLQLSTAVASRCWEKSFVWRLNQNRWGQGIRSAGSSRNDCCLLSA